MAEKVRTVELVLTGGPDIPSDRLAYMVWTHLHRRYANVDVVLKEDGKEVARASKVISGQEAAEKKVADQQRRRAEQEQAEKERAR